MSRRFIHALLIVTLALGTLFTLVPPVSATSAADRLPEEDRFVPATLVDPASSSLSAPEAAAGEKWIEVSLSKRTLIAREGNKVFLTTRVSIGKPSTPTVRGTFRIYAKLRSTRMRGPGYDLPNVPHTMYFHGGYAIHGAYWVRYFGGAISHGCINVNLTDAARLFNWAPIGTRVVIHN